ncbi:hypothetical protein X728_11485 [Mesorhizobium sp. L103C120A0]|nr:hypothetical protein X728_11485 [Mesorhizobium sp. L103C120A0]
MATQRQHVQILLDAAAIGQRRTIANRCERARFAISVDTFTLWWLV